MRLKRLKVHLVSFNKRIHGLYKIVQRSGLLLTLKYWRVAYGLSKYIGSPTPHPLQYGDYIYTNSPLSEQDKKETIHILQEQRRSTFEILGKFGVIQEGNEEIIIKVLGKNDFNDSLDQRTTDQRTTIGWKAKAKIV